MSNLKWDRRFANEQCGEDPDLLTELLSLLSESSKSDLQKITDALAAGNSQAVADAAHSIKGAAASIGVEGLRVAAHEIEKKGRENHLADIDLTELGALVAALADLA